MLKRMSKPSMATCPSWNDNNNLTYRRHIFDLDSFGKQSGKACVQALAFHIELNSISLFHDSLSSGLSEKVLFHMHFLYIDSRR